MLSKRSLVNRLFSMKFAVGILALALCVQCHATKTATKRRWMFQSHADTNEKRFKEARTVTGKSWFPRTWRWDSSVFRLCAFLLVLTAAALLAPGAKEANFFGCFGNGEAVGGSSLFMRLAIIIPSALFIGIAWGVSVRRSHQMANCKDAEEYNNWVQGKTGSDSVFKRHSTTSWMALWFLVIFAMGVGALIFGAAEQAPLDPNDTPFLRTAMYIITMSVLLVVGGTGLLACARMLCIHKNTMNTAGSTGAVTGQDFSDVIGHATATDASTPTKSTLNEPPRPAMSRRKTNMGDMERVEDDGGVLKTVGLITPQNSAQRGEIPSGQGTMLRRRLCQAMSL